MYWKTIKNEQKIYCYLTAFLLAVPRLPSLLKYQNPFRIVCLSVYIVCGKERTTMHQGENRGVGGGVMSADPFSSPYNRRIWQLPVNYLTISFSE